MKKILTAVLMYSFTGISAACGDLSSYRVDGLAFERLTVNEAIAETLKNTPFSVTHMSPQPKGLVDATGVSGPLHHVLSNLLGRFSLSYTQNGCELMIMPSEKQMFRLEPGDMLNEKLDDWLKYHGYVLYWDAPKYRSNGQLSIMKPVDDVLKDVVNVMQSNGIRIVAEIYDNRTVRITEVKQ